MAPTLPSELIKHILELLYEDLRSPDYLATPFNTRDGEKLACFFHPILLVSKTFYALALPIAIRHLFRSTVVERATDKLHQALGHIFKRSVGQSVKSICLPVRFQADYLTALPLLRTLHSFHLIKKALLIPSSLTTLVLQVGETLNAAELRALALASPNLTALSLSGHDNCSSLLPLHFEESPDVVIPKWSLKHLALHYLTGSKQQVLALITSSAATLESLTFTLPNSGIWVNPNIRPRSVLDRLDRPLSALRRLDLGELHPPSRGSTFLDRPLLPSLEYLTLPISRRSIHQILTLSLTLIGLSLIAVDLKLKTSSPRALDTLKAFIKGRPALRLLSIDCDDTARVDEDWYDDLRVECDALDITFASSSLAETEAEMWTEEEDSGESETEEEIQLRREREEEALPFDFDAEDGEEWAHLWSEEKRQAMGLGKSVCALFGLSYRRLTCFSLQLQLPRPRRTPKPPTVNPVSSRLPSRRAP